MGHTSPHSLRVEQRVRADGNRHRLSKLPRGNRERTFTSHPARPSRIRLGAALAAAAWLSSLDCAAPPAPRAAPRPSHVSRERLALNDGWRFHKYSPTEQADDLIYDVRPEVRDASEREADARPTEAATVQATRRVLAPWILPSANDFIQDTAKRHVRPAGHPGNDFPFVQGNFDDSTWERVDLPHDWAISGPFLQGPNAEVGGGMGRLPSPGVAWYRKTLSIPASDAGRSLVLEVDGAMSYAMVWLNGNLVGGWPYGYASWQLDLTPYVDPGADNQLAIRLDNPPHVPVGIRAEVCTGTSG